MDLLSKPERKLLEWLEKQDSPVLVDKLLAAPSYDPERCRSLVDRELVSPVIMGLTATAYKISDKGRAALEASTLKNLALDLCCCNPRFHRIAHQQFFALNKKSEDKHR